MRTKAPGQSALLLLDIIEILNTQKIPYAIVGAFARIQEVDFMKMPIRIIGLEDFVAMKIFAGSPIDIQDARQVLEVSGLKIDMKLLQQLTRAYGPQCLQKLKTLIKSRTK